MLMRGEWTSQDWRPEEHTKASEPAAMVVMLDRLSQDRKLKERWQQWRYPDWRWWFWPHGHAVGGCCRIMGWCGNTVDGLGCDIGGRNRLLGWRWPRRGGQEPQRGWLWPRCGQLWPCCGWPGCQLEGSKGDQSRNNWDGSNLSSGGWATAREVGTAARAVGLQRWRIDCGKGGAGQ